MITKEQIALQTLLQNNMVPKGNVNFVNSIAYWNNASVKQLSFVQKMIDQIIKPNQAASGLTIDTTKLHAMFASALQHLKYPKVNLQTKTGIPVRFSVSKQNANIIYMNAGGYSSTFYGYINSPNQVNLRPIVTSKGQTEEFSELISDFAKDPAGFTATHGKLTHSCCYCSKGLTTKESLAVGYGPDCAKHYGLPWGAKVKASKPNIDDLVNAMEIN